MAVLAVGANSPVDRHHRASSSRATATIRRSDRCLWTVTPGARRQVVAGICSGTMGGGNYFSRSYLREPRTPAGDRALAQVSGACICSY